MSNSILTDKRICTIVSKPEIEEANLNSVMQLLASLNIHDPTQADPDALLHLRSKISIIVAGYDDDPRELYEIPNVRGYFQAVQANWPYGLYFFDHNVMTAHLLVFCHAEVAAVPSQNRSTHKPQINSASVVDFLTAAFYPICDITERLGWTPTETLEVVKDIVVSLGLKDEIHPERSSEKRERHKQLIYPSEARESSHKNSAADNLENLDPISLAELVQMLPTLPDGTKPPTLLPGVAEAILEELREMRGSRR